ncbi:MAG: ATP-binding protein [Mariniblastus sp.]|nr:ATP-binding protein [Mariniblastus sp.]MDG1513954.1 ATP-binding protein [Mariniblastus sp.]MDG2181201.1 ATP-binding protein [Mariniblastus sp.]|eukprot:COSAG01_NODE_823_length_13300_cov_451.502310_11_plen_297_part_00
MPKILVVDDSSVDRMLVGGLLGKEPTWQIEFAVDGKEGFDRLSDVATIPDVIVTDLQMPRMDGLELVRQVRKSHPLIPIVLITSFGSEQIAIDALRAGATSYTPKTMLQSALIQTIKQVLEMSNRMQHIVAENETSTGHLTRYYVLENESSMIGPTIEVLQENLPSWSSRDRLQIGMALDEALVNAMHHGNLEVDSSLRDGEDGTRYYEEIQARKDIEPYVNRRVRIEAEFSDKHICVQISDDGRGFDPGGVPDPTAESNLHKVSGRGLFLIRSFMDQVAHNTAGNQITMTKLRRD